MNAIMLSVVMLSVVVLDVVILNVTAPSSLCVNQSFGSLFVQLVCVLGKLRQHLLGT
jgi:hypothetical protein